MSQQPKQDENKEISEQLREDLKVQVALRDVSHLLGVKLLVKHCGGIITACVNELANGLERPEVDLRALCSTLKANLDLYQMISGATDQVKAIEEALNTIDPELEPLKKK